MKAVAACDKGTFLEKTKVACMSRVHNFKERDFQGVKCDFSSCEYPSKLIISGVVWLERWTCAEYDEHSYADTSCSVDC